MTRGCTRTCRTTRTLLNKAAMSLCSIVLAPQAVLAPDSPVMLVLHGFAGGAPVLVRSAATASMLVSAVFSAMCSGRDHLAAGEAATQQIFRALLDAARQVSDTLFALNC